MVKAPRNSSSALPGTKMLPLSYSPSQKAWYSLITAMAPSESRG